MTGCASGKSILDAGRRRRPPPRPRRPPTAPPRCCRRRPPSHRHRSGSSHPPSRWSPPPWSSSPPRSRCHRRAERLRRSRFRLRRGSTAPRAPTIVLPGRRSRQRRRAGATSRSGTPCRRRLPGRPHGAHRRLQRQPDRRCTSAAEPERLQRDDRQVLAVQPGARARTGPAARVHAAVDGGQRIGRARRGLHRGGGYDTATFLPRALGSPIRPRACCGHAVQHLLAGALLARACSKRPASTPPTRR